MQAAGVAAALAGAGLSPGEFHSYMRAPLDALGGRSMREAIVDPRGSDPLGVAREHAAQLAAEIAGRGD